MKKNIVPFSIKDVRMLKTGGPWRTKSNGILRVRFSFPEEAELQELLRWNNEETKNIPNIRGLRYYSVEDLHEGEIGGKEFHKVRQEMIFVTKGSVLWRCKDLYGNIKINVLTPKNGIWMPPFILHTYEVLEEGTGLAVIANTTFDPENPATHDTFSFSEFQKLKHLS